MVIATDIPLWVRSTGNNERPGRLFCCCYTALFPCVTGTCHSHVLIVTLLADHTDTSSKRPGSKCLKAGLFPSLYRQRVYSIEFKKHFLVDDHRHYTMGCKSPVGHHMLP